MQADHRCKVPCLLHKFEIRRWAESDRTVAGAPRPAAAPVARSPPMLAEVWHRAVPPEMSRSVWEDSTTLNNVAALRQTVIVTKDMGEVSNITGMLQSVPCETLNFLRQTIFIHPAR